MIDQSNPAGRLYRILSNAKGQQDTKTVKEVWALAIGIEEDNVQITKGVVELYSLSQEIQSLIEMNERLNHQLYLSSFNQIDQSFFPLNLNSNWKSVKQYLTDEALTRLQFCAEELSKFYSEESLSEDDLKDIITKTESLFEALQKSTLPDTLRLSLLEEVARVRNAINMYTIRGAKGLKEALQATIGSVVVNQDELKKNSDNNAEGLKRIGEVIDKLDAFASRALKLKKMLTKPIRFLVEKVTDPKDEILEEEA